jgi:hypothetical protein
MRRHFFKFFIAQPSGCFQMLISTPLFYARMLKYGHQFPGPVIGYHVAVVELRSIWWLSGVLYLLITIFSLCLSYHRQKRNQYISGLFLYCQNSGFRIVGVA